MKIITLNNKRILQKDNGTEVDISDNSIIKYTGIYYKKNYSKTEYIEKKFIGIIETYRYNIDNGIQGIYVKPLYIFNNEEWCKIIDYKQPVNKYFIYPHLLLLPYNYYCHGLYFLHTCENENLDNIVSINDFILNS